MITYTTGGLVSGLPSDFVKDEDAMTYTFSVKAGDVVSINLWTRGALDSYTYTITVQQ